jgi:hypothetical protein
MPNSSWLGLRGRKFTALKYRMPSRPRRQRHEENFDAEVEAVEQHVEEYADCKCGQLERLSRLSSCGKAPSSPHHVVLVDRHWAIGTCVGWPFRTGAKKPIDVIGSECENEAVDGTKGDERVQGRAMMKPSCRHHPRRLGGLRLWPKETAFPARATSCFLRAPGSYPGVSTALRVRSRILPLCNFGHGHPASLLIRRKSSQLKLTEIDLLGVYVAGEGC